MRLLTAEQTRQSEVAAIKAGMSGQSLMEQAGSETVNTILGDQELAAAVRKGPVFVLCGPGNNGGDGFVVARHLNQRGFLVTVVHTIPLDAYQGDAAIMVGQYAGPVHFVDDGIPELRGVLIDALFGIGLSRPVTGQTARLIESANKADACRIAIDVASGVCADRGVVMGTAINADLTVTFHSSKPGHWVYPGRAHTGTCVVYDIGLSDIKAEQVPQTTLNDPDCWLQDWPKFDWDTHKYQRGAVAVLSGPLPQTGAARLAGRSALRAGAGLVTILSPANALAVHAAHLNAIMVQEARTPEAIAQILTDHRWTSCVVGPGLGLEPGNKEIVLACLSTERPTVLDADALTLFKNNPDFLFERLSPIDMITPHMGEFSRLFPDLEVSKIGRLEAARAAANRSNAVIVLKGADTVIAAPDGRASINTNAPVELATAGSGDVLAGMIAGLIGPQRMNGGKMSTFQGACAGVWLHGACGARFGPGLIAEDLPEQIPAVLQELFTPQ